MPQQNAVETHCGKSEQDAPLAIGLSPGEYATAGASQSVANPAAGGLRRLISFPVFLGALLVAGVFLSVSLRLQDVASLPTGENHSSFVEGDSWWHVAAAERILSTHTWPTTNFYSFTAPNSEWIAYEWLGELPMALALWYGGLRWMTALLVILAATIVLLLYYYAYLRSGNAKSACAACAMLLPLVGTCFTLRPQLLGYMFLLATLICLERFRQGHQNALWIVPVLFIGWVNTHGTFVFGFLALFVYWASGLAHFQIDGIWAERWTRRQRLHLEIAFLLSVIALAVTPYGTRLIGYVLNAASQPVNLANIQEWQALDFHQPFGKIFLALLMLFLLAHVLWRFEYRLGELALLLFTLCLACVHQRFLPLFAVMFAPILATLLARWVPPYQPEKDQYVLNAVLITLVGIGVVALFPSNKDLDHLMAANYPVRALEYMREHPVPGPMLNEHSWGGYLIHSRPAQKVFIDGREDAYEPAGVFADYLKITQVDKNTLLLLRKYGVKSCLIENGSPLGTLLGSLPDWQKIYGDDVSNVFVHMPDRPNSRSSEPYSP